MTRQEAFQILELPEDADRAQIRHAYSAKSKGCHVETQPEAFGRLHEAYKTALINVQSPVSEREKLWRQATDARENIQADLFPPQKVQGGTEALRQEESRRKEASQNEKPTEMAGQQVDDLDALLQETLGGDFSIRKCQEITRLIYHKCRYEDAKERHPEKSSLARDGILWPDEDFGRTDIPWEDRPLDNTLFFHVPWKKWKKLGWICIICHPGFLGRQYEPGFLRELYGFLREENLNRRDGIGQNLYFSLCMAYGFFYDEYQEPPDQAPSWEALNAIQKLLHLHPKRQEYLQDLQGWAELRENHGLVLFVRKAFRFSKGEGDPEARQVFVGSFLASAEEKLLTDPDEQKEFIVQNLLTLPGDLFSRDLSRRKQDCEALRQLQEDFFRAFEDAHDYSNPKNDVNRLGYRYRLLSDRIEDIRARYSIVDGSLKKIVCNPVFLRHFSQWLHPRGKDLVFDPRSLEYEFWKEFRQLFDGDSRFEQHALNLLTKDVYFPEYEKRYQRELQWEAQQIEKIYFQEALPVPELNREKLALLHTIEQGTPATIEEMPRLLGSIYRFDDDAFRFLGRIANAMVHFKFLLIWPKYEKDPAPGDAICFLEDEVILYRKKENLTCHLSHAVFYDVLSRFFDMAAKHAFRYKHACYSEEFLDTACKNLYLYRCYIRRPRIPS